MFHRPCLIGRINEAVVELANGNDVAKIISHPNPGIGRLSDQDVLNHRPLRLTFLYISVFDFPKNDPVLPDAGVSVDLDFEGIRSDLLNLFLFVGRENGTREACQFQIVLRPLLFLFCSSVLGTGRRRLVTFVNLGFAGWELPAGLACVELDEA
jgi:hypothetical protein